MPIYEFKCAHCGNRDERLRRLGDTQPPTCHNDNCDMALTFSRTRQIIRPWGYNLKPGDKGYWDFGDANEPGYRPPESVEMHSAFYAAEADIERMRREGDDT